MIWLIAYLVVGLAFALYMPVKQRRSLAKIDAMTTAQLAELSDDDRKTFETAAAVIRVDYTMTHLVVGGLLWPTQIVALVVVEILFALRRSRNGCDH